MSISSILGARLYRWYLNYTAGTWTDVQGSGDATQATGSKQPAVATTNSGQSYPQFDGTDDYLGGPSGAGPVIGTLPTYASSQNFLWGFLLRVDNTAGNNWIWGIPNWNCYVSSGTITVAGVTSNIPIGAKTWYRVIVTKNGSTGTLTMYVNGVAQTVTTTDAFGNDWKTGVNMTYGIRNDQATGPLNGALASMFWAFDAATPFSPTDVSNCDAQLQAFLPTTRFYLASLSANVAAVSPTPDASWTGTTGAVYRRMSTTKLGETIAAGSLITLANSGGVSAAGTTGLVRVFVGDSMAAQTLSCFLSAQNMGRETSTAHNIDGAVSKVYVVSSDGSTVRGVLLAFGEHGTFPNEFTNASSQRNVTVISGLTASSSVAVQDGDRPVYELGVITSTGGTGTPVTNGKFGDNATDLPVNDTQTTDGAPWLEFSQAIVFGPAANSTTPPSLGWTALDASGLALGSTTPPSLGWTALNASGLALGSTSPPSLGWTALNASGLALGSTSPPSLGWTALDASGLTLGSTSPPSLSWTALDASGLTLGSTSPPSLGWTALDASGLTLGSTSPPELAWEALDAPGLAVGSTTPPSLGWTALDVSGLALGSTSPPSLGWTALDASGLTYGSTTPPELEWEALDAAGEQVGVAHFRLSDAPLVRITLRSDMARYNIGDIAVLYAELTMQIAGAWRPIDPASVSVRVHAPSGLETTPTVSTSGTGLYQVGAECTEAGIWRYRWTSEGLKGVKEHYFIVDPNSF